MMNLNERAMNTNGELKELELRKQNEIKEVQDIYNDAKAALVEYGVVISEAVEVQPVVNNIVINKGKIVEANTDNETIEELEMQLDIAKEEIEYYHNVEKDYNNDIELFQKDIARHLKRIDELVVENEKLIDETIELENEIAFKDGQIIELQRQIKELEEQTAKQETVEETKEQDIPKDKYDINELDEIYRNDNSIINNYYLLNNPNERPLDNMPDKYFLDAIQKRINEIDNEQNVTFEYCDKYQKYAIQGTIKLNDVTYKYQASNKHDLPTVYGCFDMDEIRQAKEMIEASVPSFKFFELADEELEQDEVIYDFDNKIVVWINRKNNSFKGYTENYAFVWDGQSEYPTGVQHKYNKFDTNQYAKMGEWTVQSGKNKGQKAQRGAKEAALILSTCKALMNNNNEESEQTNEEIEFIYTAGKTYWRIEERIADEKRLAAIAEDNRRKEEEQKIKNEERFARFVANDMADLMDI